MMAVKFNSNFAETFVSKADIQALEPQAAAAQKTLMDGTGAGNVHAIHFCSNNKLNLKNGSNLTISFGGTVD